MKFNNEDSEIIIRRYVDELDSLEMIAKDYNTYVNKIRRFLIKRGVPIRTNSESQKIALSTGRNSHPTEGRVRTREEKGKIAVGVSKFWSKLTPEKMDKIREDSRKRWEALSPEDREDIGLAAKKGMQKAAAEGSKMEKFIHEELEFLGIPVIFHKKGLVGNESLEVDIFIPSYNTAVEIDGPTHFLPIFGEDRLQKTIDSDREKVGLLLVGGINILRIKHLSKSASLAKAKKMTAAIVEFLDTLVNSNKSQFKEIEI